MFLPNSSVRGLSGIRIAALLLTLGLLPAGALHAQTGTWTGAGGAVWDTTATNWSGVTGTPWDATNGLTGIATFDGANTPSVSGTVYVNQINKSATAGATTISNGTIFLAGSTPTITNSSTSGLTISSILSGTNGLTKSGSGVLTLTGSNNYTGATAVSGSGSVLAISNASALGASSGATTVGNRAELRLSGGISVAEPITINGFGAVNQNDIGALANTSGTNTLTGLITLGTEATDNRITSRAGALNITGGVTSPNRGLQLCGAGDLNVTTNAINLGTGRLFVFGQSGSSSVSIGVAGNTMANLTIWYAGRLRTDAANAFSSNVGLYMGSADNSNGRLDLNGNSQTFGNLESYGTGTVVITSASAATLSVNQTVDRTYAGQITGAVALTKSGTGVLTLTGSSNYTGATAVSGSGSVLAISNASALGASSGATTVGDRAELRLSGGISVAEPITINGFGAVSQNDIGALTNTSGTNTLTGLINLGTEATDNRITSRAGALNITGGVTSPNRSLQLCGAGDLNVTTNAINLGTGRLFIFGQSGPSPVSIGVAGNTMANLTIWYAGRLRTDVANAFSSNVGLYMGSTDNTNGTLDLNGNSQTFGNLESYGTATVVITSASAATLSVNQTVDRTYAGQITGAVALTKAGASVLTLTGSNTFTGATAINAGILSIARPGALEGTSGVTINGGAGLTYTGDAATLAKNVTVTAGSGTGTIRNTGGGLLTLSGNLSKDNSVLRLTGGQFNVTGTISGATVNASDLLVDGTSTVTLSAVNTYNGPTFVNQSSNLIVGINDAIPSNSVVTLGNATTTGTLTLGSNTDAIGGLSFGGAGGTLRLAANSTSSALLTAATGTMTLTGGTLDLAGSGSTAGIYRVLSAQSIAGSFTSITGTSAAYRVITSATSVDYQQRAVLGQVNVTNPVVSIITGGSAAFTYTVANSALSGGADLGFSSGSLSNIAGSSSGTAAAGGASGSISGLVFTGTSVGTNQQGTFTVTAPAAFGATTASGTVSVNVLDHATSSLAGSLLTSTTISLGTWDYGANSWTSGGASGPFSIFNLASPAGASATADLALLSVSGSGNGFSTNLNTFTDIAGGTSQQYSIFVDPASFSTSGTQSWTFTLGMSDKTSLSGATASNTLSVTAQVIVVPEPGAIALAAIGIAAAAWARRCRSHKKPGAERVRRRAIAQDGWLGFDHEAASKRPFNYSGSRGHAPVP